MKTSYLITGVICFGAFLTYLLLGSPLFSKPFTLEDEIEFEIIKEDEQNISLHPRFDYTNWTRPQGPIRIGIQVGHWKNAELPDELEKLRGVSLGTSGGGKTEWEVCLEIAKQAKFLLEKHGYVVDLLPATVPPSYVADLFISLHADGSTDTRISGFKVAAPWFDVTKKGDLLTTIFEDAYQKETDMKLDNRITRNMRGYYAFNWFRYYHAIHPMTPAIILETGFLTNWRDQQLLIKQPGRAAKGIEEAVVTFFETSPIEKTSSYSEEIPL